MGIWSFVSIGMSGMLKIMHFPIAFFDVFFMFSIQIEAQKITTDHHKNNDSYLNIGQLYVDRVHALTSVRRFGFFKRAYCKNFIRH